jgi:hypothetical protein
MKYINNKKCCKIRGNKENSNMTIMMMIIIIIIIIIIITNPLVLETILTLFQKDL